ncbi:MAG TPA: hypothetical protein VGN12_25750 [Pirellulales bacterium]|jgi:hypothetical protein
MRFFLAHVLTFLKRHILGTVVLAVVMIGISLVIQWARNDRICAFHYSKDRSIIMRYTDFMMELEYTIDYEAYDGRKLVSPEYSCGGERLPFDVTADNFQSFEFPGDIALVQYRWKPEFPWKTIVIYDFRTGRSFPKDAEPADFQIDLTTGKRVPPVNLLR